MSEEILYSLKSVKIKLYPTLIGLLIISQLTLLSCSKKLTLAIKNENETAIIPEVIIKRGNNEVLRKSLTIVDNKTTSLQQIKINKGQYVQVVAKLQNGIAIYKSQDQMSDLNTIQFIIPSKVNKLSNDSIGVLTPSFERIFSQGTAIKSSTEGAIEKPQDKLGFYYFNDKNGSYSLISKSKGNFISTNASTSNDKVFFSPLETNSKLRFLVDKIDTQPNSILEANFVNTQRKILSKDDFASYIELNSMTRSPAFEGSTFVSLKEITTDSVDFKIKEYEVNNEGIEDKSDANAYLLCGKNLLRHRNTAHAIKKSTKLYGETFQVEGGKLVSFGYRELASDFIDNSDISRISAPNFPWPPPCFSSRYVVSFDNMRNKVNLKAISSIIEKAFSKAGYTDKSFYSVPDGFAMVARLEQINADGTSIKDSSKRWRVGTQPLTTWSPFEYLRLLLTAPKGYYRVITAIVSPNDFNGQGKISQQEAIQWLEQGFSRVPSSVESKLYDTNFQTVVVIYEFEKNGYSDPLLITPGRLQGETHLAKSEILKYLK